MPATTPITTKTNEMMIVLEIALRAVDLEAGKKSISRPLMKDLISWPLNSGRSGEEEKKE